MCSSAQRNKMDMAKKYVLLNKETRYIHIYSFENENLFF